MGLAREPSDILPSHPNPPVQKDTKPRLRQVATTDTLVAWLSSSGSREPSSELDIQCPATVVFDRWSGCHGDLDSIERVRKMSDMAETRQGGVA